VGYIEMAIIQKYYQNSSKPSIEVKLCYRGSEIKISAVVDSGSDVTMILPTFARMLRIPYERCRGSAVEIGGIGRGHMCVPFDIECEVAGLNEEGKEERHKFPLKVYIPLQKKNGFNLLGTRDFFNIFDVTIRNTIKEISLEKVSD